MNGSELIILLAVVALASFTVSFTLTFILLRLLQ